MYSAPNYLDITSDRDSADKQHYPVGKSYSDARRLENWIHQSELQGSVEGPMENAAGFLIIPAPRWWGEGRGVSDLFSSSPPPFLQSPVPELTQGVRVGEGEVPVDSGGGGAREVPGGAKG